MLGGDINIILKTVTLAQLRNIEYQFNTNYLNDIIALC